MTSENRGDRLACVGAGCGETPAGAVLRAALRRFLSHVSLERCPFLSIFLVVRISAVSIYEV